jgi:hypothetical protein
MRNCRGLGAKASVQLAYTQPAEGCGFRRHKEKQRVVNALFLLEKLVERRRIELPTFALRTRRSPS